jgi:putative ABC transport system substrate-binding protein
MIPRSVEYVDRFFRGARPADLPIDRSSAYDLVINPRTARALGLQIPQALRLQATRVIQ